MGVVLLILAMVKGWNLSRLCSADSMAPWGAPSPCMLMGLTACSITSYQRRMTQCWLLTEPLRMPCVSSSSIDHLFSLLFKYLMFQNENLLSQLGEVDTRPVKQMISKSHLESTEVFSSVFLCNSLPLSKPLGVHNSMDHHARLAWNDPQHMLKKHHREVITRIWIPYASNVNYLGSGSLRWGL